jgi:5'-deoxynucleotidase YfbR-like HD superfamily hydrolase
MKENVVQDKSFDFAVRIVNLYKHLSQEKKEFESIFYNADELCRLLFTIIKSSTELLQTTHC